MLRYRWLFLQGITARLPALLLSVFAFMPTTAAAQNRDFTRYYVDLGAPGATPLAERVKRIVEWNACGRELDYLGNMKDKKTAGEGTLWLIIGKLLWLQTHVGGSCTKHVRLFFQDIPPWAGTINQATLNHLFVQNFTDTTHGACASRPWIVNSAPVSDANGHLVFPAIDVDFEVTWACMVDEVNFALMEAQANGYVGTDKMICGFFRKPSGELAADPVSELTPGDWDVVVRDLLRVTFIDRNARNLVLAPATQTHIFNHLLTISGPLEEESYSIFECGNQERDTGSAQERADEDSWTNDDGPLKDFVDLAKWLWNRLLIFAAVAAALIAVSAVAIVFPPIAFVIPIIGGVGLTATVLSGVRIPETENHLFMINTSRYLTNQLILAKISDRDEIENYERHQNAIKKWLLDRLQDITEHDFIEYNARPYQRYSLYALLNLYDFATDDDLQAAAQSVLDYAFAKFAAGSTQGRRLAPFRRLMEVIPQDYVSTGTSALRRQFDMFGGADHPVAAMLLFTGQTQQLPDHQASIDSVGEMMYEASSSYRPDFVILDLATMQATYDERIHHDGIEIYSHGPGFLVSAGGIQTTYAYKPVLGINIPIPKDLTERDTDRGIAVPTMLIPNSTPVQVTAPDFLRIEGVRELYSMVEKKIPNIMAWSWDHNTCVRKGFACGINIVVPPAIAPCLTTAPGAPDQWRFIDSAACPPYAGAPHFYVVVYTQPCTAEQNECLFEANWGFFEAVDATGLPDFDQFKQDSIDKNPPMLTAPLAIASSRIGTYVSARGETITFDVRGHELDNDHYGISAVNNIAEQDIGDWAFASGMIEADGDGNIAIKDPQSLTNPNWTRKIVIDFTDKDHPKHTVVP
jgi:hypothetical protein